MVSIVCTYHRAARLLPYPMQQGRPTIRLGKGGGVPPGRGGIYCGNFLQKIILYASSLAEKEGHPPGVFGVL